LATLELKYSVFILEYFSIHFLVILV